MTKAIFIAIALALGPAQAADAPQKGKSADKAPPPARKHMKADFSRKAPQGANGQSRKPAAGAARQGVDPQGTHAQGLAHD